FRKRDRMFFQRGFAKATLDNINPKELITLKKLARYRFSLTDQQLTALVTAKELNEITEEEK
ncbi:MAG: type II toxin-antitoxin system RelE/ParE family toxin, partial [Treponema sp.]|nr:type II toxin-antitoxin system RelE/ParE family toxin [Treponema sp.]